MSPNGKIVPRVSKLPCTYAEIYTHWTMSDRMFVYANERSTSVELFKWRLLEQQGHIFIDNFIFLYTWTIPPSFPRRRQLISLLPLRVAHDLQPSAQQCPTPILADIAPLAALLLRFYSLRPCFHPLGSGLHNASTLSRRFIDIIGREMESEADGL